MRIAAALVLVAALSLPAGAQEWLGANDFLTEHEVDQVREAQEPNLRIETYLSFVALRMELINQLLAKEEAGRGGKIHKNLDELGRILEAVDMVIDDALLRDVDLTKGMELLRANETALLARLEEIQASDPEDLWRFEFVLEDAIEIAGDSLELAGVDPNERKRELIEADDAEKAAREKTMSAERLKDVQSVKQEAAKTEQKVEQKRPSLLKKGETLGTPAPPKKN
ncbi:MAG: hypothetical protein GC160_22420 [Acidobacteria bacterium]|nr:hypothetical protein [Acidobacteriota bacterium]